MGTLKSSDLQLNSYRMFSKSDFGKPISEDLSTILRRNLNKNHIANIAAKSNVGFSTIRDVVYRTNSLTESNAEAIMLLVHAAFEDSVAYKLRTESDIHFSDALLKL